MSGSRDPPPWCLDTLNDTWHEIDRDETKTLIEICQPMLTNLVHTDQTDENRESIDWLSHYQPHAALTLTGYLLQYDLYFRSIIQSIRYIHDFATLGDNDQVVCLKGESHHNIDTVTTAALSECTPVSGHQHFCALSKHRSCWHKCSRHMQCVVTLSLSCGCRFHTETVRDPCRDQLRSRV